MHSITRAPSNLPRDERTRLLELEQVKKYNNLVAEVQDLRRSRTYTPSALSATSNLLTQNPEYNTIWNYRRQIFLHLISNHPSSTPTTSSDEPEPPQQSAESKIEYITTLIKSDLLFLFPLLTKYPKCYWIWNYRNFLLQTASTRLPSPITLKFWQAELDLVTKMLGKDSRNFHGWGYRRIVIANIEKVKAAALATAEIPGDGNGEEGKEQSLVEQEFIYTTQMINKNMSNFSAWHQRSKLIPRLLKERKVGDEDRMKFLNEELSTMKEALYTDPYDQSIHLYHHWLLSSTCSSVVPNVRKGGEEAEIITLDTTTKLRLLTEEMEWMQELLEDEPSCRLLLEELIFVSGLCRASSSEHVQVDKWKNGERQWLQKLMSVDPMRMGRWRELEAELSS